MSPKLATWPALVGLTVHLGCVLNYFQANVRAEIEYRIHIYRQAVNVDYKNSLCLWCDLAAIRAAELFHVSDSQSTTTGTAPARTIAAAQEMIVKVGRITSSPALCPARHCDIKRNRAVANRNAMAAPNALGKPLF